jgi:4-hydroxy-2-oxovalerate aldolase
MADLLECTIRDGSYVINFQWTFAEVEGIVKELVAAGFKYIEVGNGTGLGAYRKISSLLNDFEYTKAATKHKNESKIGMFFIPGIGTKEDLTQFKENGGDFVRVGTNVSNSKNALEYIEFAKELGFEVGYNFMKSYIVTPYQLLIKALDIERSGADIITVVDSAGCMLPDQVSKYVSTLRECIKCRIGFHGHNNLLLANGNNIAALQNGAAMVDATLMGMGRGIGNAQTESMIVIMQQLGYLDAVDPIKVAGISEKYILPKALNLKGASSLELAIGIAKFHDSYMHLIDKYVQKYQIDAKRLIIETSKINKENPTERLIEKIAVQIKDKNNVDIFYPKFYHKKI